MNFKLLIYTAILTTFLAPITIFSQPPLYINGEEIPLNLAEKARALLNISPRTINVQLHPAKFEELKNILAHYKLILSSPKSAVSREYFIELQKKKLFP